MRYNFMRWTGGQLKRGRMGTPTQMKIATMRKGKGKTGMLPRNPKEQAQPQSKSKTKRCRNQEGESGQRATVEIGRDQRYRKRHN